MRSQASDGAGRLGLLLVVHDITAVGGMEVQLRHLASGLVEAGHGVRIASLRSQGWPDAKRAAAIDARVEVLHLDARSRMARAAAVVRLARLARASDVVLCTGWDSSLWGRLAAILARRPAVVADHAGTREHQVSASGAPRAGWIARHNRLLDRFTAANVICAERQRETLQREGVDPAKVVLIPNGVPVDVLDQRARSGPTRAELGIPEQAKVLVHVASFRAMKRQSVTLDTVARLRETLGDVWVLFAGVGPELEAVRRDAQERDARWALFLGHQDNVAALFDLADLVVLPSASEAMPMVLIEAIAMRTPIVATTVGDIPELLEDTGAGVHVAPDDLDGFYEACHHLLTDAGASRRLASAAGAARPQVDAATMVRRYEDVLRRAAGERVALAGAREG